MNKSEVLKMVSFNYSKKKDTLLEENVSQSSLEMDQSFNYSTIRSEEEEKEEVKKLISNASFLIDVDDKNHVLFIKRAKLYLKVGLFESALSDSKTAISLKPDSIDSFILLGKALSGLNRFGVSEMAFKRADELVKVACNAIGSKNEGNRFKEVQEQVLENQSIWESTKIIIERELRHLRYNTLHSMNFDPIMSFKVSTRSSSITEAIKIIAHECDSLYQAALKESEEKSVWETGTNLAQRIQSTTPIQEGRKSASSSFGSSVGSDSSILSESSSGCSSVKSSGSSIYSTPSPSPPFTAAGGELVSVLRRGNVLTSSTPKTNNRNHQKLDKPSSLSLSSQHWPQLDTKETKVKKSSGPWTVVGKKSKKSIIKIEESTPTYDRQILVRTNSVPIQNSFKEVPDKVINNYSVCMSDIAKELRIINSQTSPKNTSGKDFLDKVLITVNKNRPTNLYKFHGIWVGGISPLTPTLELVRTFSKYGKVVSVKHLKENGSNCVFVNYNNDYNPVSALMDLNGKCLPAITVFPSKFLEVRLGPSDSQMVKYATMTKEKGLKLASEAGECFGWRNSEGCPDYNSCRYAHKLECKEIDSRPWIKFIKLREKMKI